MAQKTIFDLDLVRIAKWHRRGSIIALITILSWILLILMSVNSINFPPSVNIGVLILFWCSLPVSIVLVIVVQRAIGANIFTCVLYAFLALLFSAFVLLAVVSSAGTILRLAGAKPGFLGISADNRDNLRKGHCRKCGYSRESLEILQECPECNRVPQII